MGLQRVPTSSTIQRPMPCAPMLGRNGLTFESERNKSKEQVQKEKEQTEDLRRAAAGGAPKSPDPSRPHASHTPGSDQKLDFDAINELIKRKAQTSAASADEEQEENRRRREMFDIDAQVREKEAEASTKNAEATIAQAAASANASGSLATVAKTMQQSNGETLKAHGAVDGGGRGSVIHP